MCGIAGIVAHMHGQSADRLRSQAERMGTSLIHRGPDSGSVWVSAEAGIAFAHRRLAILDRSAKGAQPMHSSCKRYVICYNGETYNHQKLRDDIEPHRRQQWRGHSDTETILEASASIGIRAVLDQMIGLFAFALLDRQEGKLWLVRDRLGIKPLYWMQAPDGLFLFASELKAFRAYSDITLAIDHDCVAGFLRYGYVMAPHSIYKRVYKLQPGHILELNVATGQIQQQPYWSMQGCVAQAHENPFTGSMQEAEDQLAALLGDAVCQRMLADVPLGSLLSGGIDSSLVTALMQAVSTRPVRSFSIGFSEAGYDEARHAAAIARHLGCDHTELYVTAEQARNVIPELASIYDEPFADSSQIPTLLVSRMARRDVTVVLSGDGGDEVFAGYNRYTYAHRFATFSAHAPLWLRQWLRWFIQRISPRHWDHLFKLAARLIQIPTQPGDKLYKLADVLDTDHDGFYRRLVSSWTNPDAVALHGQEHTSWPCHDIAKLAVDEDSANADLIRRMQYLDTTSYLPDDILTKLDRASMAVSLEARVPLLDHRVVEFAWRLPTAWKMHQGSSKWLLRRVLGRHVPEAMFNRPKMGFAIPLDEWLRGPLREWADELLKPAACRRFGLVDTVPVSIKWQEHCTGHRNWHYPLWNVLMLHSWAERNH